MSGERPHHGGRTLTGAAMSTAPPIIEDTSRLAAVLDEWVEQEENLLRHLSFEADVPERTIYAIRNGRAAELQTVERLCFALQLPLSDVLPELEPISLRGEGWCPDC